MFTDMIGYTTLGQRHESLSLALVEEHRKLIRAILSRHEGREVKTMGDAFLIEFTNALYAVRCAYDIQRAVREFNISLPEEKRVHLRIGVHLGDIVESEGDISGDAVNVASRIESLCEDGGVCLTRQVYELVQNKFELALESLGMKQLKNVAHPVEVYTVVMPWENRIENSSMRLNARRLAVLPFANMSPDPQDEFFADGITEEVISTVSRISGLSVISRTSVGRYKKSNKSITEIGRELTAGKILEGSVRKYGNKVRITVQLLDAERDEHLWSQNYDRNLEDVFSIQSEIAQSIAREMKTKLLTNVRENIEKGLTANMEAYLLYLQGKQVMWEFEAGTRKAIGYFEKALDLDPNFAAAMTELAKCHGLLGYSLREPMESEYEKVRRLCKRALELDDQLPAAHESMARTLYYVDWDWKGALQQNRRALELDPNYVDAHFTASDLYINLGPAEEAVREAEIARRLDPLDPRSDEQLAEALMNAGRFDEALTMYTSLREANPSDPSWGAAFGRIYLLQGRVDKAVQEAERLVKLSGGRWKRGLGYAYGVAGRKDDARRIISELEADRAKGSARAYDIAFVYAGLGEQEMALSLLEKAYDEHAIVFQPLLSAEPFFANLRDEPRFRALLEKLNLATDSNP